MIYIYALIKKVKELVLSFMTKKDIYADYSYNKLHATRYYNGCIEHLMPVQAIPSMPLSLKLIQSPGYVEIDGMVFDMRQDGIYKFYKLPTLSEQRLVCTQGVSSLMLMVGYLWIYGNKDDKYPSVLHEKFITKRTLYASCGALARLVHLICQNLGFESRIVATITDKEWNGQDEGHTLLEIKDSGGKWFAYDPSFHYRFTLNNQPLSLMDLSKHKHRAQFDKLPGLHGRAEYVLQRYDYGFWIDERLQSLDLLKTWYLDKLEVPLILVDRNYCYPENLVEKGVRDRFNFRYTPLSEEAFREKFYHEHIKLD